MAVFMVIDGELDYDILWHIKQGEIYLKNGITTKDYLSWQPNLIWTTAEWLYEVLIYIVSKYTGVAGFITLLGFSTYSVYGLQLNINDLKHPFIFIAIFGLTFLFPRNMYNRPGEFQIILTIWLLINIIKNDKKLVIKSAIFGLIVGNFHGGQMIISLSTMAIMLICTAIHQFLSENIIIKETIEIIKRLQISIIVAFLFSLINPMGLDMYTVGVKVPNMYSTKFITEWNNWNIDYLSGILVILTIISVAAQKDFKKYSLESLQVLALLSAFTILQIKTQRVAGYLQAIIIIFGYKYLIEFYEAVHNKIIEFYKSLFHGVFKMGSNDCNNENYNNKGERSKLTKVLYSVIITSIIMFNGYYILNSVKGIEDFNKLVLNNTEFSIKSIEYLKENKVDTKILNGYSSGGWLIWNNIRTFVDSRQQPFASEIQNNQQLDELIKAVRGPQVQEDIIELCDKYSINYILWNTSEMGCDISDDLVNSGNWQIVIEDVLNNRQKEYILKRI